MLPETSSGENKFKINQVAVGSMLNMAEQLQAVKNNSP